MSFVSPEFVIFFCTVLPAYYLVPHRWRWLLLLLVSYLFYAYGNLHYLPLILFSTLVDYTAARRIGASERPLVRRFWLFSSIAVNLGILFYFKYFNFFGELASDAAGIFGVTYLAPVVTLALPVGISFYTFQSMSYTIDVYQGKIQPERHLGRVATYVAFFPQLVAGPIERATNLLPQFEEHKKPDEGRIVEGLQQILWGFFKKVVIADRVAIYVNTVYNQPGDYTGWPLILATFFFAFQIYCDFSAYSDIAIGTARILGWRLMENFRQPYFARTVPEFWRRWHISLSTWFRDYVYLPLGGSRVPLRRHLLNLMIVFVVSGLWHGAGWTFLIWGALHGIVVAWVAFIQRTHGDKPPARQDGGVWGLIWGLLTFAFVCFTWIFFRANSMADAAYIATHLFVFDPSLDVVAPFAEGLLGAPVEFALSFALIGLLIAVDFVDARGGISQALRASPAAVRWALYYACGAAVIFSGLYGAGAQQFIYFRF